MGWHKYAVGYRDSTASIDHTAVGGIFVVQDEKALSASWKIDVGGREAFVCM